MFKLLYKFTLCLLGAAVLMLLLPKDLQAQEPWTLQACIDYAKDNNLQLQQDALDIENNAINLNQARMDRLPNLNASASHSYNFGRSIDPFTNQFATDAIQSNFFAVTSGVTLFNGFRLKNVIRQSEINMEASRYGLETSKNNVMLNTVGAYLDIILNREILENTRRQVTATEEQLLRTRKLVEAGAVPRTNLYDLEAQKASDELQATNAENSLRLAYLRMKQLLTIPDSEPFEIAIPNMPDPESMIMPSNPDVVYQEALNRQPEVKQAELNRESAKKGIEIAQSGLYPRITLDGNMNTNYSSRQRTIPNTDAEPNIVTDTVGFVAPAASIPGDPMRFVVIPRAVFPMEDFTFFRQLEESFRQNIGVSMQIPIFNRKQVRNDVQRAKIQSRRSEIALELTKQQIQQTIEQAYLDARNAQIAFRSNGQRVRALQESLRAAEVRLAAGAGNITDYNIAKTTLSQAEADLLRAKYDFIFKVKILDFYQGKQIVF